MAHPEFGEISQETIDSFRDAADAHVAALCRDWMKEITGTNCTWVDDDLRVLAHLANRAVKAGLTDTLPESMRACLPAPLPESADLFEEMATALSDLVGLIDKVAPEYSGSPMASNARIALSKARSQPYPR